MLPLCLFTTLPQPNKTSFYTGKENAENARMNGVITGKGGSHLGISKANFWDDMRDRPELSRQGAEQHKNCHHTADIAIGMQT
jgi:hypothetical protein